MSGRSFFVKGYQFPVCARCTGVFIGNILSVILLAAGHVPHIIITLALCLIMLIDWLLQFKNILESTNARRLVTGVMGGYGLMAVLIYGAGFLFSLV